MSKSPPYDHYFKILVVGDSSVGKTTVTKSYFDRDKWQFNEHGPMGIGFESIREYTELYGQKVLLQIWEMNNVDRNRTNLLKSCFCGAMGIVIMYDVTEAKSFEDVEIWLQILEDIRIENNAAPTAPRILVGNKCDRRDRQVSHEEGVLLAQMHCMRFFETSAKTLTNITESTQSLLDDLILTACSNRAIAAEKCHGTRPSIPCYSQIDPPNNEPATPDLYKIIMFGEYWVGKTSLLNRFLGKEESAEGTTVGWKMRRKFLEVLGKKVELQIIDTESRPEVREDYQFKGYWRRSIMGIMLVYDITDEETFANAQSWLQFLKGKRIFLPTVSMILVGNKCDLDGQRRVAKEEGKELARRHGISFVEASAKTSKHVDESFKILATDITVTLELAECNAMLFKEMDDTELTMSGSKRTHYENKSEGTQAVKVLSQCTQFDGKISIDRRRSLPQTYTVLLVGEDMVGKTSLLDRYVRNEWKENDDAGSTDASSACQVLEVLKEKIRLNILDTASKLQGEDQYKQTIQSQSGYRHQKAIGVMVVYDVTSEKTFAKCQHWLHFLEDQDNLNLCTVSKILVGNKCDLEGLRQVAKERGEMLASKYEIRHMEVSAKSGFGVNKSFEILATEIMTGLLADTSKIEALDPSELDAMKAKAKLGRKKGHCTVA